MSIKPARGMTYQPYKTMLKKIHSCRPALLTLLSLLLQMLAVDGSERPNIVLIFADDLGYGDVGYHGNKEVMTPHIDSIARDGVVFTAGYASAPVCGPSRAGLLTGLYQNRFGFVDNPGPYRAEAKDAHGNGLGKPVDAGIPDGIKTIGHYMQEQGYVTGVFGKWHDGDDDLKFYPLQRGFDEFFGFNNGASAYEIGKNDRASTLNRRLLRGNLAVEREDAYLTDAFGREAVSFIRRHKQDPFFLYVPFNAVHGPLVVSQDYQDKFAGSDPIQRRKLLGMLLSMDENIGKILDELDKQGLEENTLVIFLSDNGGKPDGNYSFNGPLRGIKGQLWDGGIRVPFCVKWPAKIAFGRSSDIPVIAQDILPTIVDAAGGEIPTDAGLDGRSFLQQAIGSMNTFHHDYIQWTHNQKWAIRDMDWKLILPNRNDTKPQLFHISDDIGETTDLYKSRPEVAKRLQGAYDDLTKDFLPQLWGWDKSMPFFVDPAAPEQQVIRNPRSPQEWKQTNQPYGDGNKGSTPGF